MGAGSRPLFRTAEGSRLTAGSRPTAKLSFHETTLPHGASRHRPAFAKDGQPVYGPMGSDDHNRQQHVSGLAGSSPAEWQPAGAYATTRGQRAACSGGKNG